jgi:hypothetical protein
VEALLERQLILSIHQPRRLCRNGGQLILVKKSIHPAREHRSLIGQTYGAASAVLSIFALGGIIVSLILQSREARANREQGLRALHVELVKLSLTDPLYLDCFGPFGARPTTTFVNSTSFNLLVSHWETMWEVGGIQEPHLRALASDLFAGERVEDTGPSPAPYGSTRGPRGEQQDSTNYVAAIQRSAALSIKRFGSQTTSRMSPT